MIAAVRGEHTEDEQRHRVALDVLPGEVQERRGEDLRQPARRSCGRMPKSTSSRYPSAQLNTCSTQISARNAPITTSASRSLRTDMPATPIYLGDRRLTWPGRTLTTRRASGPDLLALSLRPGAPLSRVLRPRFCGRTTATASSPCAPRARPGAPMAASRTWPKARIAASPGIRMGVPASTPNTPTLVIVIVPPVRSPGVALPARAVAASSSSARASPASESAVARP